MINLTPRQQQVLLMTAEGSNQRQIADDLGLTTSTVATYLGEIRNLLGAENTAHACYLAVQCGLLYFDKAREKIHVHA